MINYLLYPIVIMIKTIFDDETRNEVITRINSLHIDSSKQWWKMNVYQMILHCSTRDAWVQGNNKPIYKRSFIGRIFGRMVLKRFTKDDKMLDRNTPTTWELVIHEIEWDFAAAKAEWVKRMSEYENFSNDAFVHDFFGKMTREQIWILAYKHADHHLRQFNS